MDNFDGAEVMQTSKKLFHDDFDDLLVIDISRFNEVYDRSSLAVFHDYLISMIPFKYLVKLDDIRMIHFFKELELGEDLVFFVSEGLFF